MCPWGGRLTPLNKTSEFEEPFFCQKEQACLTRVEVTGTVVTHPHRFEAVVLSGLSTIATNSGSGIMNHLLGSDVALRDT